MPEVRPRDVAGRFVPLTCPDPNCDGQLVYEADHSYPTTVRGWRCNGLVDPGCIDQELQACTHWHGG